MSKGFKSRVDLPKVLGDIHTIAITAAEIKTNSSLDPIAKSRVFLDTGRALKASDNVPGLFKRVHAIPLLGHTHVIFYDSTSVNVADMDNAPRITRVQMTEDSPSDYNNGFDKDRGYHLPLDKLSMVGLEMQPNAVFVTARDTPPTLLYMDDVAYIRRNSRQPVGPTQLIHNVEQSFGSEAVVYLPEDFCSGVIEALRTATHNIQPRI